MEYKIKGVTYRDDNGYVEVLRDGQGWKRVDGAEIEIDVGGWPFIYYPPTKKAPEPPSQKENDLFYHFAGLAMQRMDISYDFTDVSSRGKPESIIDENAVQIKTKLSCAYAQAMIDELKNRGRL